MVRKDRNTETIDTGTAHSGGVRDWQRWTPYAAVVWSLVYAVLGLYWALGGDGFPYTPAAKSSDMGPLAGRFGISADWVLVITAGIPAVIIGAAMLRGIRGKILRPLFIIFGVLLSVSLLLLMTSLDLLVLLGYIPYVVRSLIIGAKFVQQYLLDIAQWGTIHQLFCLVGGFLWLVATVCYIRRSADACLYCGRHEGPEGWTSPSKAARWGRIAVVVSMVVPVLYAITRYAWALGIPLGMSEAYLRSGQEIGTWTSGLFLATFGLVGGVLQLGLVQRWGEIFPRWMIGLGGYRVPIALAVIPASVVSVLLVVGGTGIWLGLDQMTANIVSAGLDRMEIVGAIVFQVGPTLLFPVWGVGLATATLGYYYRRRGPCKVCSRGASGEIKV